MLQRTTKLLIGKDISRDAQVVAGAIITTTIASTGLADGEIVVLDKTFKVLAAGATISDTDIIYICQGTGGTYNYTGETGVTVSGARKIIFSDPIYGKFVKSFVGTPYSAPVQQVTTFDLTGVTPIVGTEYFVRIVYTDVNAHPGQFTHTYRITAAGTTLATDLIDALDARVNAHSGRRVDATNTATTLVLTGKAIPEGTTSLNDIDKFSMVAFDAFLNYVDSDGNWAELGITSKTTVPGTAGSGSWYQVRDMEKEYLSDTGPRNRTDFPVILPAMRTEATKTYNFITIEHERPYTSPDNQYVKYAPMTTVLAFVVPNAGTQQASVLAQLNPWMASTPAAFSNVVL